MGKANKKKVIKKREAAKTPIQEEELLEDKEMNWDDVHEKKLEVADRILKLQTQINEIAKVVDMSDDKDTNAKVITGLSLSTLDLAKELKQCEERFGLQNKRGPVISIEIDGKDGQAYISALYGMINIEEKLITIEGTSLLDLVISLTGSEQLKEESVELKKIIAKEMGELK